MTIIQLPKPFQPLLGAAPLPARTPPGAAVVEAAGERFLLSAELLARAASLSMDTIFEGGMLALGLHSRDTERLQGAGFSGKWAGRYRAHLEGMMQRRRAELIADAAEASALREGGQSALSRAQDLVREVLRHAQPAGVRDELRIDSASLGSFAGTRDAVLELLGQAQRPAFVKSLTAKGLAPARLKELAELPDALLTERAEQIYRQGRAVGATDESQVLKAMALAELTLLSQTARAALPEERAERYQLRRLLGVPPRDRRADPAEPRPADPTPADPGADPARPAPPAFATGAGPFATGATGTFPTGATGTFAPAPTGAAALPPGTVLCTLPARGGPSLAAVIQPDGVVAWVPTGAAAAEPAPASAPVATGPAAATGPTAPRLSAAPAPATPPANRSRARRR